ncbi:sugar phosphate isomerase/epimerase [Nakamurella sp. PAMC28650]|uniref:sugar phosphate isomerase/epimerase family protein n=1 Tax=Nakamurella sp. PAMC28650 TaxID=2762325 RepID=UPI00164E9C81|nr:sugar phosphate isomerase/epimerase [Nakamurella sp. PAMC28650]QNK80993.1 TIM barrel protein [Nakamurella sp. PAMC28650]
MTAMDRIGAAPISWGVCEVPGWGYQLPPDLVLTQMRELGITATEFGPDTFLPADPAAKVTTLAAHGLHAVGGFVPVLLHESSHDPLPGLERELDAFVAAGAGTLVLAASTGVDGYDDRPDLDEAGWRRLLHNLDRLAAAATARGVVPTLHPHVGTMIEKPAEVDRVLGGSGIALTLDTGHLMIGGNDVVSLAASAPDRIAHTHLKDVRADLAQRVQRGEITYTEAVAAGLYVPLGTGDVDLLGILGILENAGYAGWYVMEQDTILSGPEQAVDALADVAASLAFLTGALIPA